MKPDKDIVAYSKKIIDDSFGNLRLADLAETVGYSHKYIDKVFKLQTGETMKNYANKVRIEKAVKLIEENRMSEIIDLLGYYDQSHFITSFKRYKGMTPRQYKESILQSTP